MTEKIVGNGEFAAALRVLIGKPLWAAIACETTGTMFLFDFGCKVPEKEVYEKPIVPKEGGFVGEVRLTVLCSWRIESGETRLLVGCGDSHKTGGPMLTGLQEIVGDIVTDVSLGPLLDLMLTFRTGRRLRLFCDRREDDLGFGHYHLWVVGEHERVFYSALNNTVTCERKPRAHASE